MIFIHQKMCVKVYNTKPYAQSWSHKFHVTNIQLVELGDSSG